MSSSVEQRIVGLQFDNKQFEAGTKTTMSTMEKLKASLNFDGAKKSVADLAAAGKNFTMENMGDSVDGILGKFSALEILGVTALVNIGNKAVDMGLQMAKSLTLDPIKAGFDEYELKMGSIQTILANTARYGTQLPEVTAALDDLNGYADKTIYNFGDMTKNIGLFTNAGIGINDATSMIKGFSNAAAASGTSAEGASGAAYQLSQALSAGKITLMDWKSLTNVGMGNKNMQDGVIELASAMGTFKGTGMDATTAAKDFNGSLEKGWLKADVMSNYLKIMAGDMTAAEQAALGLSDEMIAGFAAQQVTAEEAATKVRTWTQLYGTLEEAVGSSWTDTFGIVIGDFEEATDLFTSISDTVGGVIGKLGTARNDLLQGWKDLGGRDDLINIGKNLYNSVANIIAPITKAWAKIFPPDGGSALKGFTGGLATITGVIEKITSGLVNLAPIFEVVFGLFKIGFSIVSGLLSVFVNLFAVFGGVGIGGVTGLVGGFAALIATVIDFVNQGQYIQKFFAGINTALQTVLLPMIDFFMRVKDAVVAFVKSGDKIAFIDDLKKSLGAFEPLIDAVSAKLTVVVGWFQALGDKAQEFGGKAQGVFGSVGNWIAVAAGYIADFANGIQGVISIVKDGDFLGSAMTFGLDEDSGVVAKLFQLRDAFTGVNDKAIMVKDTLKEAGAQAAAFADTSEKKVGQSWNGIGGGISAVLTFLKPVIGKIGEFFGWIGERIKQVVEDLTGQDIVALINTGVFIAAYMSVKDFFSSFSELFGSATAVFEQMGGVFDSLTEHVSAMTEGIKADTLLKLAISLGILAAAVWVISTIDVADLAAATIAIGLMFRMMSTTMSSIAEAVAGVQTGPIVAAGVTMILLATAILILSAALKVFASMSMGELAKSIITLAIVLKLLVMTLEAMPETQLVKSAAALVVIGAALLVFSVAILAFAAMDLSTVAEGIGYLAATLVIMSTAMRTMPEKEMLKNAVALGIVAVSLQALALAILTYSKMDVSTVATALGLIGASLVVLGIGLKFMNGTLGGAVALGIVAGSLLLLSIALKAFGNLSMEEIGKSLLVLVLAIGIFAGAALLLTPIIPVMGAFAVVLLALGVGLALAGAGMFLFATAFALLAVSGAAGSAGFTAAMIAVLAMLPLFAQQLGLAVKAFALVISESGPEILAALTTLLLALIQAIVDVVPPFIEACVVVLMGFLKAVQIVGPELIQTIVTLIKALVNAIVNMVSFFVDAGMRLITGVINGITANVPKIIQAGTDLIVALITGIGNAAVQIATAALETLLSFLEGLERAIRANSSKINDAGIDLADAIVDGVVDGLKKGIKAVTDAAKNLVGNIGSGIKKVLGIASPSKVTTKLGEFTGEGFANGVDNMGRAVYKAALGTGDQAVNGLKKGLSNISSLDASDVNINPVIRPVLDLTDVNKEAGTLDNMLTPSPIQPVTSTLNARTVSTNFDAVSKAQNDNAQFGPGTVFEYNQYNSSPKALSEAEIYRQTKNQMSTVKKELLV